VDGSGVAVMDADGTDLHVLVPEWGQDLAWSPDGTRIAYTTAADEIGVVDADGGAPIHLGRGIQPAWSPDGTRIAAAGSQFGGGLVVYDLAAGTRQPLAQDAPFFVNPAWSPSGDTLAYAAFAEDGYRVYLVSAEGGVPRRLTDGWAPSWSPDGRRLAVVRDLNLPAPIDLVDLEGRTLARLTETGASTRVPWSRPGSLAFLEYAFVGRNPVRLVLHTLVLVDADGGERRKVLGPLVRPALAEPDLSASGRRLLVTMFDNGGDFELYRRDEEGGRLRQLTDDVLFDDSAPAASPDGRRLAFARGGVGEGGGSIYLMDADGRDVRRLTEPRPKLGVAADPTWSPDGAEIAFARPGGGTYVVPAAGGPERGLVSGFDPAWSPRGSELAVATDSGLALVPARGGRPHSLVSFERASRLLELGPDESPSILDSPAWSPYGDEIAFRFQYQRQKQELSALLVVRRDGTRLRVVLRDREFTSVAWSPDGRWFLVGGADVIRLGLSGVQRGVIAVDVLAWESDPAWLPACTVSGTRAADRLRAGPRGDLVCGLGGGDRLVGARGRDRLLGHGGNDRIWSVGGGFDVVGCGSGRDVVVVDWRDRVGRDCEHVTRR
jgi:TolB protein